MCFKSVQVEPGRACGFPRGRDTLAVLPAVESLVAAAFQIGVADIRSRRRGRAEVAFARQVAMYLSHVTLGLRLTEVGAHFGRDRTTVAHGCARVEDRRDEAMVERILTCLEAALERWRATFHDRSAP